MIASLLMLAAAPTAFPAGPGSEIAKAKCSACHAVPIVTGKRANEDQWATWIDTMVARGVKLTDPEYDRLLAYLVKNFGPVAAKPKR